MLSDLRLKLVDTLIRTWPLSLREATSVVLSPRPHVYGHSMRQLKGGNKKAKRRRKKKKIRLRQLVLG
jgi:hypothetical protein